MNKTLLILSIATMLMITVNAGALIVDKAKLQELKTKNKILQDPVLTIKGAIEKPDSYVLKLEAKSPQGSRLITAFLDKQTDELYMGSAYDKGVRQLPFPKMQKL